MPTCRPRRAGTLDASVSGAAGDVPALVRRSRRSENGGRRRARKRLAARAAPVKTPVASPAPAARASLAHRRADPPLPPRPGERLKIAVVSIDPSRRNRRVLLGDRIRMNAINHPNIFMRSLAARATPVARSQALPDVIAACKVAGFDLIIIVETSGIGQGDAGIVPHVDVSPLRDDARSSAPPRSWRRSTCSTSPTSWPSTSSTAGRADALRDVRKQVPAQPRGLRSADPRTCRCSAPWRAASTTTASPRSIRPDRPKPAAGRTAAHVGKRRLAPVKVGSSNQTPWCRRSAHAISPRSPRPCAATTARVDAATEPRAERQQLSQSRRPSRLRACGRDRRPLSSTQPFMPTATAHDAPRARRKLLAMWPATKAYAGDEYVVKIRDRKSAPRRSPHALRHQDRKVVLPRFEDGARSCAG